MQEKTTLPRIPGNGNTIIYGCIVGSHAYGTNVEGSDVDKKWVYVQSANDLFLNGYQPQVNISKDETAYELSRFLELAEKANPTILELFFSPEDCILYKDETFDQVLDLKKEFLTMQCKNSFGGYAVSQIEKARGLDKKMNWEKERTVRKTVLDFCYFIDMAINPRLNNHYQSAPIKTVFSSSQIKKLGLSKLPNTKDLYNLFADVRYPFKGVVSDEETANDINVSDVPKDAQSCGLMYFNKDAYSLHCKEYKEYVEWLKNRNTQRYIDVQNHGQMIDGKNLLHCVRLIETALDIAEHKVLLVRRPNAEWLKDIRKGNYHLEDILVYAEKILKGLDAAYRDSGLPNKFSTPSTAKSINFRVRKAIADRKIPVPRMTELL